MTSETKPLQAKLWARAGDEWYVEDEASTDALLHMEHFQRRVWDPACGHGNIVRALVRAGLTGWGSDIVDRREMIPGKEWPAAHFEIQDFLQLPAAKFPATQIVMNPPFGHAVLAERFIRHALSASHLVKLAVFADVRFLGSEARGSGLWAEMPPSRIYFLTPRPSCPPGAFLAAGGKASGGTADFCWCVWDRGERAGQTTFHWLRRR